MYVHPYKCFLNKHGSKAHLMLSSPWFHQTSSAVSLWTDLAIKKGGTINTPPDHFLHLLWLQLLSQPTWLHVRHKLQVTKVTPYLVRTIFSLPLLSGGVDLPSVISPGPQPQPTLTRLRRAAKRILIHSSSALPGRVRCCWSSGWVQESFFYPFISAWMKDAAVNPSDLSWHTVALKHKIKGCVCIFIFFWVSFHVGALIFRGENKRRTLVCHSLNSFEQQLIEQLK